MHRPPLFALTLCAAASTIVALPCRGQTDTQDERAPAAGLEHFESRVRPLLLERCGECHGADKQKSGLRVDHREHLLRGGSRGPAIVPGKPDASLLAKAIAYVDVDLSMPPKNRLSRAEVDTLRQWIADGAVWPDEPVPTTAAKKQEIFDLEARRDAHWCWRAPVSPTPPRVRDAAWPANAIDRFVLAELEAAGQAPADPADRRTWLRRVTFDLTGLPPTRSELDAYLADDAEGAETRVVDRLLASLAFAEHQARHWLDLVRYAETLGHEFDFKIENAWQYRDYVIRAFDAGVPYDRFVHEHIAGDLLESPRKNPREGFDESILGTGFWWLGEQTHSPVDARKHQADRIDNQIDVASKTFLGVTVGCARCHDHKFDAISTKDYYAMFGFLESSRYAQVPVEDPARQHALRQELAGLRNEIGEHALEIWAKRSGDVATFMRHATEFEDKTKARKKNKDAKKERAARKAAVAARASKLGIDAEEFERWVAALESTRRARPPAAHPLRGWFERRSPAADPPQTQTEDRDDTCFVDFSRDGYEGWTRTGTAFGPAPTAKGASSIEAHVAAESERFDLRMRMLPTSAASSASISRRLSGGLYSPSFTLDKRYVHIRACGRASRINLVPEGFTLLRNPIWGGFKLYVDREEMHWYRFDTAKHPGLRAWLEFLDQPVADPADPSRRNGYPADAWIAVERVVFSDSPAPPSIVDPSRVDPSRVDPSSVDPAPLFTTPASTTGATATLKAIVDGYASATREAVEAVRAGKAQRVQIAWLDWLGRHGLLLGATSAESGVAAPLVAKLHRWRELEEKLTTPGFAPALLDASPVDHAVHVRGDHRHRGDVVEPRFLEALPLCMDADALAHERQTGSGRLALAHAMTHGENPLTSRVMVNRIWHHMFGRGIVATTDNFGVLGQKPTHPELLDWLARRFVADGWSIRKIYRLVALSSTYRMSSRAKASAARIDPTNRRLHATRVRRLAGESIRDAILAISGRLEPKRFGRGVATHLTPFLSGRGRPGRSGPLDGAGRRSIYLEVRRNFLHPFFLAFDRPSPVSTFGRRAVSNVPAQALSLLNDPFVLEQASVWGRRVVADSGTTDERVRSMFVDALSREPSKEELENCKAFLEEQARAHGAPIDSEKPFADLAHVIFNIKEFTWLR